MTTFGDAINKPEWQTTGLSFLSRCGLPDIHPNTKILAVCGISDYIPSDGAGDSLAGIASPAEYGWFFEDFFLLHHLFKGCFADQEWLLCEKPEMLVEKYTAYYDSHRSESRVVLDKSMLDQVNDITYIEPQNLLPEFLKSVSRVVAEAERDSRHLLVIVLSHGCGANLGYAMVMGGGDPDADDCPRLDRDAFKKAVVEGLGESRESLTRELCLMTSAYFSSGWAINPEFNVIKTSAAEAPYTDESLSWPPTGSLNRRFFGSDSASQIADMLLRTNFEDLDDLVSVDEVDEVDGNDVNDEVDADDAYEVVDTGDFQNWTREKQRAFKKHPQYADLIWVLREALYIQHDEMISKAVWAKNPAFGSDVKDEWEIQWRDRTGVPLTHFRSRWELLEIVPGVSSTDEWEFPED